MGDKAYMVTHQLVGHSYPYADGCLSREQAEALFYEFASDSGVASVWMDEFTDAGRETIGFYHNKSSAVKHPCKNRPRWR